MIGTRVSIYNWGKRLESIGVKERIAQNFMTCLYVQKSY